MISTYMWGIKTNKNKALKSEKKKGKKETESKIIKKSRHWVLFIFNKFFVRLENLSLFKIFLFLYFIETDRWNVE